ncbi:hypothetical protein KUV89_09660 [Marinobacter hydrocarbonoclasticus]|nr:hypothetical protein [Marinobacter nauticus]
MMATEQQLDDLSQRIATALQGLSDANDEQREVLLAELADHLDARESVLTALLSTPAGQDPEWLQTQLRKTQQLAIEANQHLAAQRTRLGGYRKGRKQVQTYQQIEAGKG